MPDRKLDQILIDDPVLVKERAEEAEKARQRKLNDPSIDQLLPEGQEGQLSKTNPRADSWQDAVNPEDAADERMRETLRVNKRGGQD